MKTMGKEWLIVVSFALLLVLNIEEALCTGSDFVNITIVADAVSKGALCLDGSPAGYHLYQGFGDGANSWLIYLEGGGWCATKTECLNRAPEVSSTKNISTTYFDGILSQNPTTNPDFYNWNKAKLRYCDGSSFAGDVDEVDPESNLHYRGARIFSAVVEELLTKGLANAENVILTGTSAGGLATILNCDRLRAMVPSGARTKCISDSGFFIRAKYLPNADRRKGYFAQVVQLHEIAKFLPESCTSRMDPGLCFFPENLVGHVETPLFILNSAFDQYQVSVTLKPCPGDEEGWTNCIQRPDMYCTPAQLQVIKAFKDEFVETIQNSNHGSYCSSKGLFINSCYIHGYIWKTLRYVTPTFTNKSVAEDIGDWFFDRRNVKIIDTWSEHPIDCNI